MHRGLRPVLIGTLLVAGCGATPTTPPAAQPSTAASPEETLAATPATSGLSPTANPGDGAPDPDGRIAFGRIVRDDSFFGQVVALWAIDPDGSDLVQLNEGNSGFPAWSPDGSRLAFTQYQADGTWQIATMAPDGSDVRVLTKGLGTDGAALVPRRDVACLHRFRDAAR